MNTDTGWTSLVWLYQKKNSIWNLKKTDKELHLSFMIKSSFWSTIVNDLLVFSMKEIIAGSILILSTANALCCICMCKNTSWQGLVTSAVLFRIWHLVMLNILWNNRPRLFTVPYFSVRSQMLIDSDGPPFWSLDASDTRESTKCRWVAEMGLKAWG